MLSRPMLLIPADVRTPGTVSNREAPKGSPEMIRIGPAGWSYKDWNGIVYPKQRPKGFHEAEYLSHYFDTIEINTSFYHPIRPQSARSWIDKVSANKSFRFTAKLWRGFTHERNATSA